MKGYKITNGQKNQIIKSKKFYGMRFNPIQDTNGDWIILQSEAEYCNKFLNWNLEEIEFTPKEQINRIE